MKRNRLDLERIFDENEVSPAQNTAIGEAPPVSYARELRALGQALEEMHLSSLDLEVEGGIYVVRGNVKPSNFAKSSFVRFVRDLLGAAGVPQHDLPSRSQVDLRYTPQQIEQIDSKGRTKRQKSDSMPDPYSLSQILRGAGSYLDHRDETALIGISIKDRWVSLRYKTPEGQFEQAKQDLEYFYDYWVKMYLRRSNRSKLPPPSDPTLIVTWEGLKKRCP